MPRGAGGKSTIKPSTMRGRDWPCLRQFCVFMENRVGHLHEVLRQIERDDLRVVALSILDSVDFAAARMILSDYDRAKDLFDLSNVTMIETDVIGVLLPDDPQPILQICTALMQAEVNIHYTYPLLYRKGGRGAIILCVDDVDLGLRALSEKGLTIVTEKSLLEDDENL